MYEFGDFSGINDGWIDGCVTCDFTSFLTVFQSYQANVWMIKAVCNGTPFTLEKIPSRVRIELGPLNQ